MRDCAFHSTAELVPAGLEQAFRSTSLGTREFFAWCERVGDLALTEACSEQSVDQEVEGDGRIAGLHLGHPGLAGLHELGEIRLGQIASLTGLAEPRAERELHLDERFLCRREAQEIRSRADSPTCSFKTLTFAPFHVSFLLVRPCRTRE